MLYGLGLMLFLVSMIFADGSILMTVAVAVAGLVLMAIGGEKDEKADTER